MPLELAEAVGATAARLGRPVGHLVREAVAYYLAAAAAYGAAQAADGGGDAPAPEAPTRRARRPLESTVGRAAAPGALRARASHALPMKRAHRPTLAAAASGLAARARAPARRPVRSRCASSTPRAGSSSLAWVALVPAFLALRERAVRAGRAPPRPRRGARLLLRGDPLGLARDDRVRAAAARGSSLVALTLPRPLHGRALGGRVRGRWPSARGSAGRSSLHLPFVWVALELSRNYLFTGFPWANLGYTQARTLPVAQLAALAGVYAIAALVVLVNAVARRRDRRARAGRPLPRRALAVVAARSSVTVGPRGAGGSARCARARWPRRPRSRSGSCSRTWTSR